MAEPRPNEAVSPEPLHDARRLLRQALVIIDQSSAPLDVGARLDEVIHRLDNVIEEQPRT